MVEIRPFRAIRYTKKAGNYQNLITQPYDKINSNMQKEYYEKSEYNYCRLTLPTEENRYEISKKRLNISFYSFCSIGKPPAYNFTD